jgi:hypothetical protein
LKRRAWKKFWNSTEVLQTARYELEAVVECGGRDLQVRILEWLAGSIEFGPDAPEYLCSRHVEWQNGDRWNHSGLDVLKVAIFALRSIRALVQFSDRDRAYELVLAGD